MDPFVHWEPGRKANMRHTAVNRQRCKYQTVKVAKPGQTSVTVNPGIMVFIAMTYFLEADFREPRSRELI
jgi:hypothetical protein